MNRFISPVIMALTLTGCATLGDAGNAIKKELIQFPTKSLVIVDKTLDLYCKSPENVRLAFRQRYNGRVMVICE